MKMLFFHEAEKVKISRDGRCFTDGSYDSAAWARYLRVADELVIAMRVDSRNYSEEELVARFNEISLEHISFVPIPDVNGSVSSFLSPIKRMRYASAVKRAVTLCDCVINRVPGNAYAARYARAIGKPYLLEVVGCAFDSYWNYSWRGKIFAIPAALSMKRLVKRAPDVVYVTKRFLEKRYPTKGKFANCSNVAIRDFDEVRLLRRLERIFSQPKTGRLVVGTTAAVDVRYKGQQYIIEALGKLRAAGHDDFEYHLVGNGDTTYLKTVAQRCGVADRVFFLGSLPHSDVFTWLDAIDLYVQPSRQEGLPRALIEAMSRGLPASGARTGGIPELLEEKFIFSNTRKNIDEICAILLGFLNPEIRKEQALRNFEASKEYDGRLIEARRQEMLCHLSSMTGGQK